MRKFAYFVSTLLIITFFVGCQDDPIQTQELVEERADDNKKDNKPEDEIPLSYPGQIIVKVSEEAADNMDISELGEVSLRSVGGEMGGALRSISTHKVERLFPPAGKYEARTRKAGLHRWYKVEFDENIGLKDAVEIMKNIETVDYVETVPVVEMLSTAPTYRDILLPFNDEFLEEQWHYNNTGNKNGYVMGADINLFKAWEIETGKPNVIVCVVDGGVDYTHPDLAQNMWVNEAELNGAPGVDNDNNGYVNDVHGWCFVTNTSDIVPDADTHGTHVAGTIAAVNNNGIGVSGVAGGNGSPDSGVRIMSAAIFRGTQGGGNAPAAIKYGADNGAVICQNSWGYTYTAGQYYGGLSPALKDAIDYFVKYAGCDENGNQRPDSPMKGGVVLFSAGNDNVDVEMVPASYEPVIAVASVGPDFGKALYSCYGSWVDIAAPGGDQTRFGTIDGGVLSTLSAKFLDPRVIQSGYAKPSGNYGYYQGTSMACPHVSGVAALIASKFGGPGFTNEDLKARLFAGVAPVDIDKYNPYYKGQLGVGLVDAYTALTLVNHEIAPEKPKFLVDKFKDNDFTSIDVYWTVPADEDDGTALRYKLYISEEELNKDNYKEKGKLAGPGSGFINGAGKNVGDEVSFLVEHLKTGTTYYFALEAYDRWGIASEPVFTSAATKVNNPPEILNMPEEPITLLDVLGSISYELEVKDIDGHRWKFEPSGSLQGVTLDRNDDIIKVTIRTILEEGDYTFKLRLIDELDEAKDFEIPFKIIKVVAPELVEPFPNFVLGVNNQPISIKLSEFFSVQDMFDLKYKIESKNESIVTVKIDENGSASLKGIKPGSTTVIVTADNGYKTTTAMIYVTVTENADEDVYAVWPLPMGRNLNIWLNPKHKTARVRLQSMSGDIVLDNNVNVNETGIGSITLDRIAIGPYILKIDTDGGKQYSRSVIKR
ncbi:MAG: S8 family serine peptidase [Fermentimonas sp.]